MSLAERWGEALRASNRRWLRNGWMFDTPTFKTCLKPDTCPMRRSGNKCISQWCILRYPEEIDLEGLR